MDKLDSIKMTNVCASKNTTEKVKSLQNRVKYSQILSVKRLLKYGKKSYDSVIKSTKK